MTFEEGLYKVTSEMLHRYFTEVNQGKVCMIEDIINNWVKRSNLRITMQTVKHIEECCRKVNRFYQLCEAVVRGYSCSNGRHVSDPYPLFILFYLLALTNMNEGKDFNNKYTIITNNCENTKELESLKLLLVKEFFNKVKTEDSITLREFLHFLYDANHLREYVKPILLQIYEEKFIELSVIKLLESISTSTKYKILAIISECTIDAKNKEHSQEQKLSLKELEREQQEEEEEEFLETERAKHNEISREGNQFILANKQVKNFDANVKTETKCEQNIIEETSNVFTSVQHTENTEKEILASVNIKSITCFENCKGKMLICNDNCKLTLPPTEVRQMALTLPVIKKNPVNYNITNEKAVKLNKCKLAVKEIKTLERSPRKVLRNNNNITEETHSKNKKNVEIAKTELVERHLTDVNISADNCELHTVTKTYESNKCLTNTRQTEKITNKETFRQSVIDIPQTRATLLKLSNVINKQKHEQEKMLEETEFTFAHVSKNASRMSESFENNNKHLLLFDTEEEYYFNEKTLEIAREKALQQLEMYQRHLKELEVAERKAEEQREMEYEKRQEIVNLKNEYRKEIEKLSKQRELDLKTHRSFVAKLRNEITANVKKAEENVLMRNINTAEEVKKETSRLQAIAVNEEKLETDKKLAMVCEIRELRKRLKEERKTNVNATCRYTKKGRKLKKMYRRFLLDDSVKEKNVNIFRYLSTENDSDDNSSVDVFISSDNNDDDDGDDTNDKSNNDNNNNNNSIKTEEEEMVELYELLLRLRMEREMELRLRKDRIDKQRRLNKSVKNKLSTICKEELDRRRDKRTATREMHKLNEKRIMEWKKSVLQTRLAEMHNKLTRRQEDKQRLLAQSKVDTVSKQKLHRAYKFKNNELEQRRWAEFEKARIDGCTIQHCAEIQGV